MAGQRLSRLLLLLLLLPTAAAAWAAEPPPDSWPQIVIASEFAPIPGLLRGGNFRLELGPTLPTDAMQGRLILELQPDSTPAPTPITMQAQLNVQLDPDLPGHLRMVIAPAPLKLPEAQALLSIIPGWPPLLTLEQGLIQTELELAYSPQEGLSATGNLSLSEGEGIYATAFFRGLNLQIPFTVTAPAKEAAALSRLEATIQAELAEFNPGVALGPVRVEALYRTPLNDPGRGELTIGQLEATLLGGLLRAEPATLSWAEKAGRLNLQVIGLDLARLLTTHPVEGLKGSGLIDGRLPLRWGPEGFGMSEGQLTTRPPGGRLSYESAAAAALTLRNPTIKLVLDALGDLHYSVLSSGLDYREDGTLHLALRLEGKNPAFEQGRPIILELNLEENIPALLASLQLSNRISDTIRQRIEEQYR